MRPVVKTNKQKADGTPMEYTPWGKAKKVLISEIGSFCSFCEKYNSRSALHVEHIYGKKCINAAGVLIYDTLKHRWDNFLLACVNCNSVKGNKDIALTNPYMPHINNLIHYITINTGGLIQIKAGLSATDTNGIRGFINLTGIDRVPGHSDYSDKDDRWDTRLKVYDIVKRQYQKYTAANPTTDLENIIQLARTNGFFSIWYYQFITYSEVINVLINGIMINGTLIRPFPGIHLASFDPTNNFITLPRP
ncbi:HNH endonuclease [Chitinophaga varians]|uniref:HNH endonuclease n=1 Tax=Chitinophaga varians TaxID=2202339 RepID=A0A847RQM4_9BACT|nr:HNH endonuclease signature motif containing protein [Chitinophaga varians]NLR63025.1 HNH endonuclease [Chitinophaga varians]